MTLNQNPTSSINTAASGPDADNHDGLATMVTTYV